MNPSPELKKLICSILEISSVSDVANKFNKAELDSVIEYYSSKKQILIDQKDNSSDGYEIQRVNGELSSIKIETVKINKAIAIINARPKPKSQVNAVQKTEIVFSAPSTTDQQKSILEKLSKCKTIPDIHQNLELPELLYVREYYGEFREAVVLQKDQNTDQTKVKVFNFELQRINKQISRINKAITLAQKDLALQNMAPNVFVIENEFSFLKSFFQLAESKLDEAVFAEIKQQAVEEYATRHKQNSQMK